jgi:hypothetical protein
MFVPLHHGVSAELQIRNTASRAGPSDKYLPYNSEAVN